MIYTGKTEQKAAEHLSPDAAGNDRGGERPAGLKDSVRANCERWLERIEHLPDVDGRHTMPDLYSVYKELCAVKHECKTDARKNHKNAARLTDELAGMKSRLNSMSGMIADLTERAAEKESKTKKEFFVPILELHERLQRIAGRPAGVSPDGKQRKGRGAGFVISLLRRFGFKDSGAEKQASLQRMQEAVAIVLAHFDAFLYSRGIERIVSEGQQFDAGRMRASGTAVSGEVPEGIVLKEVSPGYRLDGTVIKYAAVIVSKRKKDDE